MAARLPAWMLAAAGVSSNPPQLSSAPAQAPSWLLAAAGGPAQAQSVGFRQPLAPLRSNIVAPMASAKVAAAPVAAPAAMPLAGPISSELAAVRSLARQQLSLLPNLRSKKAKIEATDAGTLIRHVDEIANWREQVALRMLISIPQPPLERTLGDSLVNNSAAQVVDEIVRRTKNSSSQRRLEDATRDWIGLRDMMVAKGGAAAARAAVGSATIMDLNEFLTFRRDRAHARFGSGKKRPPAAGALNPLDEPQDRSKSGETSPESVKKKLKYLASEWHFDWCIDDRVRVAAIVTGPGRVCEKAPCPSLKMMKILQLTAADKSKAPMVRHICRALCVMGFAVLREEQTHLFGVLAALTHDGRTTLFCKTKRKLKNSPTEYLILPLSGVIDDGGAWYEGGDEAAGALPAGADFLLCAFEAPEGRNANNPYLATRTLHAAMDSHQADMAIANILHTEMGISFKQARRFTRHSFKHFLPEIINTVPMHREQDAIENCSEVARWAGSTLASNPRILAPADRHRERYVLSIAAMPRNYSESAQLRRLRLLAQHQLDRAAAAITRAGNNLPDFGGFVEFLEP